MTTEKNRLTVQAAMEDHKLELATAAANAWLQDQDKRERERIKPQMELDRIFGAINQKAQEARQAPDYGLGIPAPAKDKTVESVQMGAFGVLSLVVMLGLYALSLWIM